MHVALYVTVVYTKKCFHQSNAPLRNMQNTRGGRGEKGRGKGTHVSRECNAQHRARDSSKQSFHRQRMKNKQGFQYIEARRVPLVVGEKNENNKKKENSENREGEGERGKREKVLFSFLLLSSLLSPSLLFFLFLIFSSKYASLMLRSIKLRVEVFFFFFYYYSEYFVSAQESITRNYSFFLYRFEWNER